jgi:hypothetical protein
MIRVLVLALAIAAAPMPSLAGEASPAAPAAPVLKDAIAKAAASMPLAKARAQATGGKPDKSELGSTSFFKKPAGIIALVVVAVGTGYAFYSVSHDRIHSVVRKGQ